MQSIGPGIKAFMVPGGVGIDTASHVMEADDYIMQARWKTLLSRNQERSTRSTTSTTSTKSTRSTRTDATEECVVFSHLREWEA